MADEAVVRIKLEEGPSSKGASAPPPSGASAPAPAAPTTAAAPSRDWVRDLVEGIAGANRHVLIEGQSGSGKSLMTRHLAFERMARGEEVSVVDTHSPESWAGAKQVFQGESAAAEAAQFLRESLESRKAEASDAKMRGEMPKFEDMTIIFSDFARLMKDSPELGREFQTLLTEARKFRISIVADTTALTGAATGIKGIQDVINNFGQRVKLYAPTASDPQRHAEVGGETFDTPLLPDYKDRTDFGLVKPYSAPPKTDANAEREQQLLELEARAALQVVRQQQVEEERERLARRKQAEEDWRAAEGAWLQAERDMAAAAAEFSAEYQQSLRYQSQILEERRRAEAKQAAEESNKYQQSLRYESKLLEEEHGRDAAQAAEQSRKYQQRLQYESRLLEDEQRARAAQEAEQSSNYQQSLRYESKRVEDEQRAAEKAAADKKRAEDERAANESRQYQQALRYESQILEGKQREEAAQAAEQSRKYQQSLHLESKILEEQQRAAERAEAEDAAERSRKYQQSLRYESRILEDQQKADAPKAAKNVQTANEVRAERAAKYDNEQAGGGAMDVLRALRGTIGGRFGGMVGSALDVSAAAKQMGSSASSAAGGAAAAAGPVAIATAIAEAVKKAVQGTVDVGFGIASFAANPNADAAASVEALGDAAKKGGESLGMLGGIAGDAVKQFGSLMGAINKTADRYGEYSPQIAQVQAFAEIRQTMGDMRRSQEISGEMAKYLMSQSDLQQKFEDMKVRMLAKILPEVTRMVELLELVMPAGEAIAGAIMALLSPLTAIPGALTALEQTTKDASRPPPNDPTDALLNNPDFDVDPANPRGAGGRWVPGTAI